MPMILPLFLALTAPTAPSEPEGRGATAGEVELSWSAPASCPPASAILADVEALTGRALAGGPPRLIVSATVTPSPWRARFTARSAAGRSERTLVGASCGALAQATAVIVAIALADARRVPGAPEPEWTWPEPPRRPQPAVLTISPLTTRWPVEVGPWASAALHAGVFPDPGPTVAAGIEVTRAALRLRLGGYVRGAPDQTAEGRTLGYFGGGGRLEGCWVRAGRRAELEACGGLEGGAWWVHDQRSGRTTANPWLAPTVGVGGRHRLAGPVWLDLRLALGVPLSRAEIQVSTAPNRPDLNATVFEPAPVHPRVELGFSGHFR
jgi:hypothetical protein